MQAKDGVSGTCKATELSSSFLPRCCSLCSQVSWKGGVHRLALRAACFVSRLSSVSLFCASLAMGLFRSCELLQPSVALYPLTLCSPTAKQASPPPADQPPPYGAQLGPADAAPPLAEHFPQEKGRPAPPPQQQQQHSQPVPSTSAAPSDLCTSTTSRSGSPFGTLLMSVFLVASCSRWGTSRFFPHL
jgi:hypothetical protein